MTSPANNNPNLVSKFSYTDLIHEEVGKSPNEELSVSEWVRGGISAYFDYTVLGMALSLLLKGSPLGCKNETEVGSRKEVCDGSDNDQDGTTDEGVQTTYYCDADGDARGNSDNFTQACSQPDGYDDSCTGGYTLDSTDCDDTRSDVHPLGTEICDTADTDEDCDGLSDDSDPSVTGQTTWYFDGDSDGYGISDGSVIACEAPSGYVNQNGDCDDTDPALNPANPDDCGVPVPTFPPDGTTLPPIRASLSWDDHPWEGKTVDSYEICYSNSSLGDISTSCITIPTTADETANTAGVIDSLDENETYQWEVRTLYTDGTYSNYTGVQTFVTDDPILAWWKFDEDLGKMYGFPNFTVTDSSGNGNDGTLYTEDDDATSSGDAILGQALVFDGVNEYVQFDSTSWLEEIAGSDFTIEVRASLLGSISEQTFIHRGDGIATCTNSYYGLFTDSSGSPQFGYRVGVTSGDESDHTYTAADSNPMTVDEGFSLAGTRQIGTGASLYWDGVLSETSQSETGTPDDAAAFDDWSTDPRPMILGAVFGYNAAESCRHDSTVRMQGWIDEAIIYNRALSADELLNNHCAIETLLLGAGEMLPAECQF